MDVLTEFVGILQELALARHIFHSEADSQLPIAWQTSAEPSYGTGLG